jgi:hypothetical protein
MISGACTVEGILRKQRLGLVRARPVCSMKLPRCRDSASQLISRALDILGEAQWTRRSLEFWKRLISQ